MKVDSSRVRTVAAWAVLAGLAMLFVARYGFEIGNRKARNLPLNTLEKKFALFSKKIPINLFELTDKQFREIALPKRPDGELIDIGEQSIPFDKNYLYAEPIPAGEQHGVLKLLNLKENTVLKQWHYDIEGNYPCYLRAPVLLKDSSVVVRVVQKPSSLSPHKKLIVKIDKDSEVVWKYTAHHTHHSIEVDENGDIWTCAHYQPSEQPADSIFEYYVGDAALKIDGDSGEELFKENIVKMFLNNPRYDMSSVGYDTPDRFHLNDVQPVRTDSKFWKKGDLFISIHRPSTVFLYRPAENRILWMRNTTLKHQHDVDIVNDSVISIFDNRSDYNIRFDGSDNNKHQVLEPSNQIVFYNFSTDTLYTAFQPLLQQAGMKTPTEGLVVYYPEDSVLYVEGPDLGFFMLSQLNTGETYRCVIPSESEDYVSNLNWFRIYDRDTLNY